MRGELKGTESKERRDRYLFQIEYEQLYNKEVKECLGKLENHHMSLMALPLEETISYMLIA